MYINQFDNSNKARLNQIIHTLESVHGVKLNFNTKSIDYKKNLIETKIAYEQKRNNIIETSQFNSYQANPEYTKTLLILEAVKIMLTEIAPKRRKVRKIKETVEIAKNLQMVDTKGTPNFEVRIFKEILAPNRFVVKVFSNNKENKNIAPRYLDDEQDAKEAAENLLQSDGKSESLTLKHEPLAKLMISFKSPNPVEQNAFNRVGEKLMASKGDYTGLTDNDKHIIKLAQNKLMPKKVKEKITIMQANSNHESQTPGLHNVHETGVDKTINETKGSSMTQPRQIILENALHQQHEYEYQASMARSELYRNAKYAMNMMKQIDPHGEVPPWIAGNLTKAANYLDKVFHYLDYYKKFEPEKLPEGMDGDMELGETSGGVTRENLMLITEYSIKLFNMILPGEKLEGWVAMKLTTASECISSCKHYLDYVQFEQHGLDDHFDEGRSVNKKKMEESKLMEAETAEDLQRAKTILTAKEMSDAVQKIAETTAKLSVEDLMPLVDTMRTNFGTEVANGYNEIVKAAFDELLSVATKTKDVIDEAISSVQNGQTPGTATDIEQAEPGVEPAKEPVPSAGPELGAEEPAPAAEEPLGRAKKEVSEARFEFDKKTGGMKLNQEDPDQRHGLYGSDGKLMRATNTKDEAENLKKRDPKFKTATIKKITEAKKLTEKSPPGKKAEKWIKSNKKKFIDQYGKKKGLSVLYAKAWDMFGESTDSYVHSKQLVETNKKKLKNLKEQFSVHQLQHADLVIKGTIKDSLSVGYGIEGEVILQQIDTVQKKIAEATSVMAHEMKTGIIKLVEQLSNLQKADKLNQLKIATPFGVIYNRNGKTSKKMFESADLRTYWVELNEHEIKNVKLINPEIFDKAIDNILKGK